MEIEQKFISAPKPTLGSLKAGDVFLVDEKGLHDTSRVAYMVSGHGVTRGGRYEVTVVRLSDGTVFNRCETSHVTPVKAVLTLEVPFG